MTSERSERLRMPNEIHDIMSLGSVLAKTTSGQTTPTTQAAEGVQQTTPSASTAPVNTNQAGSGLIAPLAQQAWSNAYASNNTGQAAEGVQQTTPNTSTTQVGANETSSGLIDPVNQQAVTSQSNYEVNNSTSNPQTSNILSIIGSRIPY